MSKFDLDMLNKKYIANKNGLIYKVQGCEVSKGGLLIRVEKLGSFMPPMKMCEREFFKEFTEME